ncbi:hypothetical protein KM043_000833 [Ampulex compressa]|nr:hypothetical protein KM043_000833 [Ampulex compressa]
MVVDTSTVRLVIFLGMFLAFAGDYGSLIAAIFGKSPERNMTEPAKRPEGPMGPESHPRIALLADGTQTEKESAISRRARMMNTIKTACLPKLICELTSSVHRDQLSEMERSLLNLIRDTSLSTMAEVPSRYHFAAHMGQLISGKFDCADNIPTTTVKAVIPDVLTKFGHPRAPLGRPPGRLPKEKRTTRMNRRICKNIRPLAIRRHLRDILRREFLEDKLRL